MLAPFLPMMNLCSQAGASTSAVVTLLALAYTRVRAVGRDDDIKFFFMWVRKHNLPHSRERTRNKKDNLWATNKELIQKQRENTHYKRKKKTITAHKRKQGIKIKEKKMREHMRKRKNKTNKNKTGKNYSETYPGQAFPGVPGAWWFQWWSLVRASRPTRPSHARSRQCWSHEVQSRTCAGTCALPLTPSGTSSPVDRKTFRSVWSLIQPKLSPFGTYTPVVRNNNDL